MPHFLMNRPSLKNWILKKCNWIVLGGGLRAPRTFLGDRCTSFFPFAGSKNLSWRPVLLFFRVCGLQGPFLATVTPLFGGLRAPRTFLGDRYSSFFGFAGSKDLSWRPLNLFFRVCGLQGLFIVCSRHHFELSRILNIPTLVIFSKN
jgi:hypothetical protein